MNENGDRVLSDYSNTENANPGTWLTIEGAAREYPEVLTERLLRTLVTRREISFSRSGRRIVFAKADIERYLMRNRHEAC